MTIEQLEALILIEDELDWAYGDVEGTLRCPDCNSDAEAGCTDFPEDDPVVFHELPWDGAVAVTTERCHDCGVLLADDPACSPSEIKLSVLRSHRIFGEDSVFAGITV